jgi:hypothetical protein
VKRRGFLVGMAGILAAGAAPIVGHAGIIMPTRTIIRPPVFKDVEVTAGRFSLEYEDITCTIEEYGWRYAAGELEIGRFESIESREREVMCSRWQRDADFYASGGGSDTVKIPRPKAGWQPNGDYLAFIHPGWLARSAP